MSTVPCNAPAEPRASVLRPALCLSALAVALLHYGPGFADTFRPAPDVYPDFVQEWLSARNFWAGEPVYSPQRAAMRRHTGEDLPAFDTELPWNAHPPVAVLFALPFGRIADYPAAHLAWNLATFPLFLLSLVLIARELGLPVNGWSACAAAALIVSWNAAANQIFQGQLNFVILFLLTLAWIADRRGYQVGAGAAVGAAAALKVFPALLLVYFAATGRWRAAAAAVLAGLVLNLFAMGLFGPAAFETYVRDVLPSLDIFRAAWSNVSLTGYWTRVGVSLGVKPVGAAAAVLCQFAVVAAVWVAGRRAAGADGHDRAFALAVVGMLLASPVAWTHYFVILPLPLLLVWSRMPRGLALGVLAAASAALWLDPLFVPGLVIGRAEAEAMTNTSPFPGGFVMAGAGLGTYTYALVAIFLIIGFTRFSAAQVTKPSL